MILSYWRLSKKLGIPLHEHEALAGVAADAVFDSVSIATTFRKKLAEAGVIFCPISEAVKDYPELVKALQDRGFCARQFLCIAQ
ncbi:MAG: Fe-S cluster assembly scaffold protein SufB [Parasphingorhabdus sp.]